MKKWIAELLQRVIRSEDETEARRLPVGSKGRLRLEMTDEFQSRYTSASWNEKKREALEKKLIGPVYTVKSHNGGLMRIERAGAEHDVIPSCWELAKDEQLPRLQEATEKPMPLPDNPDLFLVTREWKESAERLAHYVNYDGDEDDDYRAYLEEGNDREDHVAYLAHVVGGWNDIVWEDFKKNAIHDN